MDVHAPRGDVKQFFTPAQTEAFPVVAPEGDVVQGHVLEEYFQGRRKAHVPERCGYDNSVRGGEPPGHVGVFLRHDAVVPVMQDAASDCRKVRPVQLHGLDFISFPEFFNERGGNPSCP